MENLTIQSHKPSYSILRPWHCAWGVWSSHSPMHRLIFVQRSVNFNFDLGKRLCSGREEISNSWKNIHPLLVFTMLINEIDTSIFHSSNRVSTTSPGMFLNNWLQNFKHFAKRKIYPIDLLVCITNIRGFHKSWEKNV